MKTVKREEITGEEFREILDVETHHNHEIIEDENGTLRWKENPDVDKILDKVSLNYICPLFYHLGYDKNSEVYRKLYRDMGISLYGYWEVFYWEANNENASEYTPPKDISFTEKTIEQSIGRGMRKDESEIRSLTSSIRGKLSPSKLLSDQIRVFQQEKSLDRKQMIFEHMIKAAKINEEAIEGILELLKQIETNNE